MNIIFFGTPEFVSPVISTLVENFSLVALVTTPDVESGRKKTLTPPPVKILGDQMGIPVLQPKKLDEQTIETLKAFKPDLFIVAAYGKIIPQSVLDIPRFGSINIHPSLLPKFRGPSPIQAVLLAGEKETGVTLIEMDEKMDHGPILEQVTVQLFPTDTLDSLHSSLFQKAAGMLPEVIRGYASGKRKGTEQLHERATYCKLVTKEDAFINPLHLPEKEHIDRMIRAYYPWPVAWTTLLFPDGKEYRVKFLPEKKIQVEGKSVVSIKEFLNGYPKLREEIEKYVEI